MKTLVLVLLSVILTGCLIPDKEVKYKQYSARYERTVFITSDSYTVSEIGGFWGASDICESHANNNPDLTGKRFIAYVTADEHVNNIVESLPDSSVDFLEFRLTNGSLIKAGKSFYINYKTPPISIDENGNRIDDISGVYYGVDSRGRVSTDNCSGYTVESSGLTFIHHPNRYYPRDAIESAQCDSDAYHFYCVQQGD